MDKAELRKDLKKHVKGAEVITKKELMIFMGIEKYDHIRKYVAGLNAIDGKYYFISDVASKLIRMVK